MLGMLLHLPEVDRGLILWVMSALAGNAAAKVMPNTKSARVI